jgi:two-component system, NtrC family, response regulator HydG
VASLPLRVQLKLFHELGFGDREPSNGQPPATEHPWVVTSTSQDLPALIEKGRFHEDLYHRIRVVSLILPPLRHRGTDIELFAQSFLARYAHEFHKPVDGFTSDAFDILRKHNWPGNVRELEAAIRRAVALCNGLRITPSNLAPIALKEALAESEKRIIADALLAANWNRGRTAKALGLDRTTLYMKMRKYDLLIDEPAMDL